MIVLHGTWNFPNIATDRGDFFFWGESSSSPIKNKPHSSKNLPRDHPFQVSKEDLLNILELINPTNYDTISEVAYSLPLVFLLPSFLKAPQPSPDLLIENTENQEEKLQMSPWKIHGLSISPEHTVAIFNSLSTKILEENNIAIGADIRFWSKVSKLVMELLVKQHFIPNIIISENTEYEGFARWQYILVEKDERIRMMMLTNSMPPICRAIIHNGNTHSPDIILSSYLNAAIDGCIRTWISIADLKSKKLGLSEAWLESLATGEPIKVSKSEIKKILEGLLTWKAQMDEEKSTFRTCFRLEPPNPEDKVPNRWLLRYLLQAADDPSLLVPAEKVWKESKDTLQFLNYIFDHPQEKLLADLGKATRLYPPIEDSLQSIRPISVQLDTNQAYIFLKEAASLLDESGFGVLVPTWWNKGATKSKLGLRLNLKPKNVPKIIKGTFNSNSLLEFNWELAIGDDPIGREEFEKLASLKEPLVNIRGQWVELKKDNIAALYKFLETKGLGEIKLSDALRLGIGQEEHDSTLPISGFTASGWISEIFERISGRSEITELSQPSNFVGTLRPYQIKGFSWLSFLRQYGLGACLADDMGLGKTIQLLALLLRDKEAKVKKPTLLICPTTIIGNWQREANRFASSLKLLIHHGANRMKNEEFLSEVQKYDLVISSYALTHKDEGLFSEIKWNGIVLDEAQNIKNPATKQSKAVRTFKAEYRITLTGTPVENRLSDLWSIMEFLNPGYLGAAESFRKKFAIPIERYNDREVSAKLRKLVSPFILRRVKTDPAIIKDLPDKIEIKVHCHLTREQATLYEAVVNDMLQKIDDSEGINRKGLILSAFMKLKQVCNHPALFLGDGSTLLGRSGKLNRITEMLEEVLAEGDAALVFTQFAEMGHMLKAHFQQVFGQEVLFLHGGIPQKMRDKMIMRFSEKIGPKIFLLSLKAGGVGLNLTRASHVFHFDRWWNPAVENQATDRAFRIGQTKNVHVHKFICAGTLEEKIDELIENKKTLSENIIGTSESWLTELTTAQLNELFTLRREVILDD